MIDKLVVLIAMNIAIICYLGWNIGIIKAQLQFIINELEGDERDD